MKKIVIPAGAHFIDVTKSSCNSGIVFNIKGALLVSFKITFAWRATGVTVIIIPAPAVVVVNLEDFEQELSLG